MFMKKHTGRAENDLQCLAGDADGESVVAGLPQNPKPDAEDSSVEQQIGQLTSREIEVLQFVARGKLNKQAASELCISIKTVEKHRGRLAKKLGIRGTAGLTHFASYAGIIQCNPQMDMA